MNGIHLPFIEEILIFANAAGSSSSSFYKFPLYIIMFGRYAQFEFAYHYALLRETKLYNIKERKTEANKFFSKHWSHTMTFLHSSKCLENIRRSSRKIHISTRACARTHVRNLYVLTFYYIFSFGIYQTPYINMPKLFFHW